jgi:hypothetical protein
VSRSDVKFTVGQAHQIAKVLEQQGRPKPSQHEAALAWIDLFQAGRCKLTPTECKRLTAFMQAVCQPIGPAQQKELASIIKRLAPPSV